MFIYVDCEKNTRKIYEMFTSNFQNEIEDRDVHAKVQWNVEECYGYLHFADSLPVVRTHWLFFQRVLFSFM